MVEEDRAGMGEKRSTIVGMIAWLPCEGCGEGEGLCIQDQAVWVPAGH